MFADLAGTEEDLLDRRGVLAGRAVVQDHPLELGVLGQQVEGGPALGVAEQGLGGHHDQGLPGEKRVSRRYKTLSHIPLHRVVQL